MPVFIYPTNAELNQILPDKIERMVAERAGFRIMPIRNVNAATVEWYQRDNVFGLQQLRGLDGAPPHVRRVGQKLLSYEPGVYGEFETITETELVKRAGGITNPAPIPIADLVAQAQDQLVQRQLDRQEYMIFTLLSTGSFSVPLPGGQIGYTDNFPIQTYSRNVAWSTAATAMPLADFRNVQNLGVGFGIQFDNSAQAWLNRITANMLLANNNPADLQGRRNAYGATVVNSIPAVNAVLGNEGLPQLNIYDEGYFNDANTFTKFIPDGVVIVIGRRTTGEVIGNYVQTRNAVNDQFAPGPYAFVKDYASANTVEKRVPPSIEIHQGHSGGPALYFPRAVVKMTVNP
jgi:hypothetical protein